MTALKKIFLILNLFCFSFSFAQLSDNPLNAVFETKDAQNFWKAFDKMDGSGKNPFVEYIHEGSPGLRGFIPYRIISADSLLVKVKNNKEAYLKSRNVLSDISSKQKRIKAIYSALKYWYPAAKFPPVYFVYGRFNSGGTVSSDGIIIGTEMLKDLNGITGLVAHELIHFQQNIKSTDNLLRQSIIEGSADFISEFVSGENINSVPFKYGESHLNALCREFVPKMKKDDYTDWLYGTSKKDDRPNDLGYWIGYKITESYFNKQIDKNKAIHDILNIDNPLQFLKESGFLNDFIKEYCSENHTKFEDFFKEYSDETYEVNFTVDVPDKNDEIYIAGNQPELGNWNPSLLKMTKISDFKRSIQLKIHFPAQFKITKGNWDSEAVIKGIQIGQNIVLEKSKNKNINFKIESWMKK